MHLKNPICTRRSNTRSYENGTHSLTKLRMPLNITFSFQGWQYRHACRLCRVGRLGILSSTCGVELPTLTQVSSYNFTGGERTIIDKIENSIYIGDKGIQPIISHRRQNIVDTPTIRLGIRSRHHLSDKDAIIWKPGISMLRHLNRIQLFSHNELQSFR